MCYTFVDYSFVCLLLFRVVIVVELFLFFGGSGVEARRGAGGRRPLNFFNFCQELVGIISREETLLRHQFFFYIQSSSPFPLTA